MSDMRVEDIPFGVVRSRRKTADIVIERDGRVQVRVPRGTTDEVIAEIVRAKRRWVYKNLAEWRDLNATRVLREFRNGEGFLYLGRSYRLRLVAKQSEPLLLRDGHFFLRRDVVEQGGVAAARAAFRAYYIIRGRTRIEQRVRYFEPKVGVDVKAISVRDLGHRWASCSARGQLAFHWKCMMAPPTVIDYIVVHELCHRHHHDHSVRFWNEVDKVMPGFRERKEWLAKNGAALDL
jgi:predicted metal-dependent hydrolase